jgi:DNA-binding protein Fis
MERSFSFSGTTFIPSSRDSDALPAEYAAPVDSSDLKILHALVEGVAQATGEDFFRALVKNLSLTTGFANAFVAEFADSKSRVRTKAFWMNGKFVDDREWDLAGTPCEDTRTMFIDITEKVLMEQEQARLREQNLYLQEEIKSVHNFEEIVGASPALTAVLNNAGDASLEAVERDHIAAVLKKTQWVIEGDEGAAKLLGMNPSTLRYRIKKLGLSKPSR